jgi:hypothetical protein
VSVDRQGDLFARGLSPAAPPVSVGRYSDLSSLRYGSPSLGIS